MKYNLYKHISNKATNIIFFNKHKVFVYNQLILLRLKRYFIRGCILIYIKCYKFKHTNSEYNLIKNISNIYI